MLGSQVDQLGRVRAARRPPLSAGAPGPGRRIAEGSEMEMTDLDAQDWFGPESATFGDRLAAAREAQGLTQNQLARNLGVRVTTLRAWEEDRSEPRANRLSMMAGLLNVSLMWLINGEGEGLDAPGEEQAELPSDVLELLQQLRDMRTEMRGQAERLGRLEKRLRATLKDA